MSATATSRDIAIRPFHRDPPGARMEDRARIRMISCDTGIAGLPIELAWTAREVFADFWTIYYTDYEPESCFVAESGGQVVGYITGCLDTERFNRTMKSAIVPRILPKLVTTGAAFRPRNLRRMLALWRCFRRGELHEPDLSAYPAHLHINLLDGYRGCGAGSRLMSTLLDYCRARGVAGIHLGSVSRRAIPFFARNGFVELSRRRFTLYDDIIGPETGLVFMGQRFQS
ncbi:MAG: GNAT family N-acetyltransferase [Candidatus Binataceae bacterium]